MRLNVYLQKAGVGSRREAERLRRQPWRAAYSDPVYQRNRARRLELCGGRCESCGAELGPGAECDHLVPLRDGGTNVVTNLRWRCQDCHRAKTRRDRRARKGSGA